MWISLYSSWQCLHSSFLVLVLPTIPSSWGYSWNSLWTSSRRSFHALKSLGTKIWNKQSSPKHSTHLDFPNINVILNFFINPFLNHSYKFYSSPVIAGSSCKAYFRLAVIKVPSFSFPHFEQSCLGQAKLKPGEILVLLHMEETWSAWRGMQSWLAVLFDFTTFYLIFTFHLQPWEVVKTILLFLEYIPGWKPIEKYDQLPWQHISNHPESEKKKKNSKLACLSGE